MYRKMATSDIMKQAVFDARIVQMPPRYAVEKGALSVTNAPFRAISATTSQHTFQVNVPSQNVFVDRAVDWQSEVYLQATVAVAAYNAGAPVITIGQDVALCAFPLHELVQTMTATINDTSVVINTDTVLHEVLRLTDFRKNRLMRHCPNMLDRYRSYTDANGAINSPIGGYFTATSSEDVPNGAWGQLVFTNYLGEPISVSSTTTTFLTAAGVTGTCANGIPTQSGGATSYPVFFRFFSSEKLVLSPFIFADACEWETGLFGINNIQLVCNMKSSPARVLRLNSANGRTWAVAPSYNSNVLQGVFQNSQLNVQFLTPSLDLPLPSKSTVPYMEFPRYITNSTIQAATGAVAGQPSLVPTITSIQSQTIVLPNIPDSLVVFVKPLAQSYGATDGDYYFPIHRVRINFDNFAGLLSVHTREQLYQMATHNGLQMDYNEWLGVARCANTKGAIQTVGGFLVIKPGQDFGLQSGQAPSLIGNFTLQFDVDVANYSEYNSAVQLFVIAINSGFFETLAGSSRIIKGVLSEADIISSEPVMEMSRDGLNRVVGAGLFSNLGSMLSKAVDIYTKTKPIVSGIKGMLPESGALGKVKGALGSVGYGAAGAGMPAGAGKKSLSSRLL
jgi:hypothetical protein